MQNYLQFDFRERNFIASLTKMILGELNQNFADINTSSCSNLQCLHEHLSISKVNHFRLHIFRLINESDWTSALFKSCFEDASSVLGPDLLIQKKINVSIQMPHDETSILPAHTDCSSGDSPFELVLWIPLTDAFSSNSMFILDKQRSKQFYKSLRTNCAFHDEPGSSDFVNLRFGQYALFSPALVHGNINNTTKSTRVSLNVRIKSIFSPYTPCVVPDRTFGTYYKVWHLSPICEWGKEVYELLK